MSNRSRRSKRKRLLNMYGPICYICRKWLDDDEVTVDHFIPLSKGGTHHISNLRIACDGCNHSKGNKLLPEPTMKIVLT